MATFGDLRTAMIKEAGAKNLFEFRRLSKEHDALWDDMNEVEYRRGYDPVEYVKPDSPSLSSMNLITDQEFESWMERFRQLQNPVSN